MTWADPRLRLCSPSALGPLGPQTEASWLREQRPGPGSGRQCPSLLSVLGCSQPAALWKRSRLGRASDPSGPTLGPRQPGRSPCGPQRGLGLGLVPQTPTRGPQLPPVGGLPHGAPGGAGDPWAGKSERIQAWGWGWGWSAQAAPSSSLSPPSRAGCPSWECVLGWGGGEGVYANL